jgi:hypothetical protein
MARNPTNAEVQNVENIAVVDTQNVVNVASVQQQRITLRLIHNYGANLVFNEVVLQPNVSCKISQEQLDILEQNPNFKHYTQVGVVEKFIAVQ